MKLCFVLPYYSPSTSDHYYHLYELIEVLAQDNTICLLAESGSVNCDIKNIESYYLNRGHNPVTRLFHRLYLLALIRSRGYQKFYLHYAETSTIMAAIITKIFGGTTYKWHCAQEDVYQKSWHPKNWPDKLLRELPFKLSVHFTDYLVTCTPQMKKHYHTHFGLPLEKIKVIPNFVCLDRFKLFKGSKNHLKRKLNLPNKPILLFVHRLAPRKGADRLLEYAQIIKAQQLPLHILAIGTGPLETNLRNQIKKQNLQNQLTLLGAIPNHDIIKYYQASDIFIMPSRVEEFGRVQLEAMAVGLPIVATKTLSSSIFKHSPQSKLIFPQNKPQSFIDQCIKLIKNKNLYKEISVSNTILVRKYSLSSIKQTFTNKIAN